MFSGPGRPGMIMIDSDPMSWKNLIGPAAALYFRWTNQVEGLQGVGLSPFLKDWHIQSRKIWLHSLATTKITNTICFAATQGMMENLDTTEKQEKI
jgi:hypothetical protein